MVAPSHYFRGAPHIPVLDPGSEHKSKSLNPALLSSPPPLICAHCLAWIHHTCIQDPEWAGGLPGSRGAWETSPPPHIEASCPRADEGGKKRAQGDQKVGREEIWGNAHVRKAGETSWPVISEGPGCESRLGQGLGVSLLSVSVPGLQNGTEAASSRDALPSRAKGGRQESANRPPCQCAPGWSACPKMGNSSDEQATVPTHLEQPANTKQTRSLSPK